MNLRDIIKLFKKRSNSSRRRIFYKRLMIFSSSFSKKRTSETCNPGTQKSSYASALVSLLLIRISNISKKSNKNFNKNKKKRKKSGSYNLR